MPYLIYMKKTGTGTVAAVIQNDLTSVAYDNKSVVPQDINTQGFDFKPDGTKLYTFSATNKFEQYTLSTPWDVSTVTPDGVVAAANAQNGTGMVIRDEGRKVYLASINPKVVFEYTLSTPYDLSTIVQGNSFDVSGQESFPSDVYVSPDGSSFYIVGFASDRVYQYSMSTPFDISTASYTFKNILVQSQDGNPQSITMQSDGTRMFMFGSQSDSIHQYTLSTPFDVSTATYDSVSFSTAGQILSNNGDGVCVRFGLNNKMYAVGYTDSEIFQYTTA